MIDSKFALLLYRIFIERPENVEENNYPLYFVQNIACIAGAIFHLAYLFIFWFIGVYSLSLFNILSVIMWIGACFACRYGFHYFSSTLFTIEILLHQTLCVIIIGWASGFQYFLLLIPLGWFLLPYSRYHIKSVAVLISVLNFILLGYFFGNATPFHVLDPFVLSNFTYNTFVTVAVMISLTVLYFNLKIKEGGERLQKEFKNTTVALAERNHAYSRLNQELFEAADYVKKILPSPVPDGSIRTNWRFVPSTSLGGDAFGYHRLDDENLAAYLIDVSGHGVGAALLSISVINVLRSQSLRKTDFRDPGQVLQSLNNAFPSEANKDMFFTMWYGVYNENSRELTYASGGHPPAILFNVNPSNGSEIDFLRTPNYVIGGMAESTFKTGKCLVGESSTLYIYSDGVYEVEKPDGSMWRFHEFTDYLKKVRSEDGAVLDRLYDHVRGLGNSETLEDDFTILEVAFS